MKFLRNSSFVFSLLYGVLVAHGLVTSSKLDTTASHVTTCLGMAQSADRESSSNSSENLPKKRIAFIRHGRTHMNDFINGIHFGQPGFTDVFPNTQEYRDKFYDSPLGPTGERQVDQLKERLQRLLRGDSNAAKELSLSDEHCGFLAELDLIVTSPLTRALQTMDKGLYPNVGDNIPVVAVPQAAERLFLVSDLGKTRRELKATYKYVDFDTAFPGHVGEEDTWHYVPSEEDIESYIEWRPNGEGQVYACLGEGEHQFNRRMEELLQWLDSRPERNIAVVCHGGVILWFLGEILDNCDIRVVDFENLDPKRCYEPPKEQAMRLK